MFKRVHLPAGNKLQKEDPGGKYGIRHSNNGQAWLIQSPCSLCLKSQVTFAVLFIKLTPAEVNFNACYKLGIG